MGKTRHQTGQYNIYHINDVKFEARSACCQHSIIDRFYSTFSHFQLHVVILILMKGIDRERPYTICDALQQKVP